LKENKEAFQILENYDKTHQLPFQKKDRFDFISRYYK